MSPKVTLDVLYALLDCRLKAYLRLTGEQGITSDYQSMLDRARQQARQTAIENIRNRYGHSITIERCPTRLQSEALVPPRIPIVARMFCSMSLAEFGDFHEPNSSGTFRQRPREGTRDNGHIATPAQL